ncbi:hypothetical protein PoB_001484000 [Plakobranchus ocellatus]|uniref:Zasp-like motif domain-containing protein n=1 Tax=Plakobranchus ocellatus TaxID=259542 RepID=A0AAV3YZF7_9GAST|nr:hypothetical protein PoB_001484000 [Plakobranchus ocellatus]
MRGTRGNTPYSASALSPSSSSLRRKSSASSTLSVTSTAAARTPTPAQTPQADTATSAADLAPNKYFGPPVVLAPVSQISRAPRRNSRVDGAAAVADKASKFDPDYYNPDGSLRTMHKLPHFEQSYAQAMQARYIRHSKPIEREQELTVHQIFEKK